MNLGKNLKLIFVVGILLLSAAWVAFAAPDPVGAGTLTKTNSSHRGMGTPASVNLIAGNITEVKISGDSITPSWAGIVGNVTARLVLDDSASKTLYNWSAGSPSGEVYASNVSNINWASGNVVCFNLGANGATLDTAFGIVPADADGVADTFSDSTTHNAFYAGANNFSANVCPAVKLNDETEASSSDWQEILLYSTSNAVPVYTSLINQNAVGYNNEPYDFEMVVLENGHGNSAVDTYYFYVELA